MRILQLHTRYREAGGEDAVVARRPDSSAPPVTRSSSTTCPTQAARSRLRVRSSCRRRILERGGGEAGRGVTPSRRGAYPQHLVLAVAVGGAGPEAMRRAGRDDAAQLPALLRPDALLSATDARARTAWAPTPGAACSTVATATRWSASAFAASTIAVARARRTWSRGVDRFVARRGSCGTSSSPGASRPRRSRSSRHGVDDPGARTNAAASSRSVLFLGRLSHEKGADTLLDRVAARGASSLELVLVGDGPLCVTGSRRGGRGREVRRAGSRRPTSPNCCSGEGHSCSRRSATRISRAAPVIEAMAAGLPVLRVRSRRPRRARPRYSAPRGRGGRRRTRTGPTRSRCSTTTRPSTSPAHEPASFERQYTEEASLTGLLDVYASVRRTAADRLFADTSARRG